MTKQSLGLIETVGLSAAIEAADTAVKSANVTLVGYELTKGGGLVVVKLLGEVGAINAAIDAAKIAASRVNQVFATKIIARMGDGLEEMLSPCHEHALEIEQQDTTIEVTTNNGQIIAVTTLSATSQDSLDSDGCLAVINAEQTVTTSKIEHPTKNTLQSNKTTKKNKKS